MPGRLDGSRHGGPLFEVVDWHELPRRSAHSSSSRAVAWYSGCWLSDRMDCDSVRTSSRRARRFAAQSRLVR